jgi:hypothetical protein
MKITINNNERKFLIQSQGFGGQIDIFCNLHHIQEIIKTNFLPNEQYKIFEFWNRRLKVCSKKHLNEMFAANKIDFKL